MCRKFQNPISEISWKNLKIAQMYSNEHVLANHEDRLVCYQLIFRITKNEETGFWNVWSLYTQFLLPRGSSFRNIPGSG